ncbi:Sensor protein fixL [Delftia tsuruhatensis]|uniref:sensor histidine kinase n=1 Tax=Delftia tsuruhatensis TaxID=180282 RepID=UPI001E753699|nr:ATP-binding protein [Delftia tsuruhatensis]CAB5702289.1 Sensor protein fixL [Delftia tsuruhatensis]CAC9691263.1 Sensor protein fixL [Delftia tsuruhatensis]
MTTAPRHLRHWPRALILAAMAAAMGAIFVLDTLTDYAVAAAVFHTAIILVAVRWFSPRAVIGVTALCIVLTLVSFALTPAGAYRTGLINTVISILAIAITAYLGLRMVSAQNAAHAARTQLMRITQTTSLGQLTASIAHEVNQPLAAIVTSGNACQRWLAQEPPNIAKAGQALERILADARRASDVIARIRSMARGEAPSRQSFDLNEAVREMARLSAAELDRRGTGLDLQLAPSLPPAWADRVHIQQVLANLLLNAMEAMQGTPAARRRIVVATQTLGHQLVLTVTDAGEGLSPLARAHLFDAFWTTKPDGMGLGLNICRHMAEANGGRIWATDREDGGNGAVFHITIACAPAPGAVPATGGRLG